MTKHIAMWSGPRNISTALMRAFENRPDTFVSDEPFYGFYLSNTDIDHPGRKEVLNSMETDWDIVAKTITGICPTEEKVWYQKHMAQHNLPGVDLSWTTLVTNCFLIRDPREVIISYNKKYEVTRAELLGLPQQVDLYRMLTEGDCIEPAIIDARDILIDPKDILNKLCVFLGIEYRSEMLSWPEGSRDTDGVWAKHWYQNVEKSTGFKPYIDQNEELPKELEEIYEECLVYYDTLHRKRIY